MTIAVTGASGQLGRRTAELLLDAVDPAAIVLVTRSPDALADLAAAAVDDAAYIEGLESAGLPTPAAQLVASFGTAGRLGYLDGVSTAVRDLTGREPTPLRDLVPAAG